MNYRTWITAVLLMAMISGASGQIDDVSAPDKDSQGFVVYTFQDGDSLQELAKRFLGGREYITELLEYNRIANPSALKAGDVLAIPRTNRNRAIAALSRAEEALAKAVGSQAEEFAAKEFALAKRSVEHARKARMKAAYDQSLALAQLGAIRANRARELADERAPVQQEARLLTAIGSVEIDRDGSGTWKQAEKGSVLPVKGLLRTADKARAEVELADGSVIQVLENSTMELSSLLLDRRDGRRNSKLKVILGDILGDIEPKKTEDSTFEVIGQDAVIAIRGTRLRVGSGEDDVTVAVLKGETQVSAADSEITLPSNFGTFVNEGKPPAPPIELLPAPGITAPTGKKLSTAIQAIRLAWEPVDAKRPKYHVEIARDVRFNEVVQETLQAGTTYRTEALDSGRYYWRVATVDNNGLEGSPTDVRELVVKVNLDVDVVPQDKPLKHKRGRVVGPDNLYVISAGKKDTSAVDFEYSINDGPFTAYSRPFPLSEDGENVIRVRSIGVDGTRGEEETLRVVLDKTGPELTLSSSAPKKHPTLGQAVSVRLKAEDDTEVDRIEVSINGEAFELYKKPLQLSAFQNTTVRYRGFDILGNASETREARVQGESVPRGETWQ